jgi:hypothetical protein
MRFERPGLDSARPSVSAQVDGDHVVAIREALLRQTAEAASEGLNPVDADDGGGGRIAPLPDVQAHLLGVLALSGRLVEGAALELVWEIVDLVAGRIVRRIDVALSVPKLFRTAVMRIP